MEGICTYSREKIPHNIPFMEHVTGLLTHLGYGVLEESPSWLLTLFVIYVIRNTTDKRIAE